MHSGLVGKSILTNIRRLWIHPDICEFCHTFTDGCKIFQAFFRNNLISHFYLKIWNYCRKICVTGALSKTKQNPLNMSCSFFYGNKRICNSKAAVVMSMNSNSYFFAVKFNNLAHSTAAFVNHKAALCFTKRKNRSPTLYRSFQSFKSISFVFFVGCKKMLSIINYLAAIFNKKGTRLTNHFEIFFRSSFEDVCYLKSPGFSKDNDSFCICRKKTFKICIFITAAVLTTC